MIVKLTAGAFIVAATSKIGFDKAKKYGNRLKDLQGFKSGLWLLKNEIDFTVSLLSTALKKCATLVPLNVSTVFLMAARRIDEGYAAKDAWCYGLEESADMLSLTKEDFDILKEFSSKLGSGDLESEKTNIDKTIERLSISEKNAVEQSIKYSKLCKTMGVTTGALIVILLL